MESLSVCKLKLVPPSGQKVSCYLHFLVLKHDAFPQASNLYYNLHSTHATDQMGVIKNL